ncbi:MAG: asparaginase domain-containing protein [Candidatus Micrarchaeota archaeon]|nr:asparaginase domain-containing protein [Candidatus Micrarchaeota archaeon]
MDSRGRILFIMTSGTIDSRFSPTQDAILTGKKSMVPGYLSKLKLHDDCEYFVACMKDSRELSDSDRAKILSAIEKSRISRVIITHGTYTMAETAAFIKKNLKARGKTIVLTGSMVPVSGFAVSDAPFNLGYAVSSAQKLKPGVYLCMNGKVFRPNEVEKNIKKGRFEAKKK